MKPRIWYLLALMLALSLVLGACSSNNDADITSIEPPDSIAVAAPEVVEPDVVEATVADAAVPATEVETTPSEEAPTLASVELPETADTGLPIDVEITLDEGTGLDVGIDIIPEGVFAGATAALQALNSYRFTTTFLFTGQEDGEIESGSIEISGEIMGDQRKHFVWSDLEDDEHFEIIQLDGEAWIYDDEEWEAVPALVADAMSQAVLVFAPSVVWDGFFGGLESDSTYVGLETIDGIPAHHYTSSYQQWAGIWEGEVLDATGDVWIAEAGYPLRYDFTATAVDEEGNQGVVIWSMQLTDAGAEIVIEPPIVLEEPM